MCPGKEGIGDEDRSQPPAVNVERAVESHQNGLPTEQTRSELNQNLLHPLKMELSGKTLSPFPFAPWKGFWLMHLNSYACSFLCRSSVLTMHLPKHSYPHEP